MAGEDKDVEAMAEAAAEIKRLERRPDLEGLGNTRADRYKSSLGKLARLMRGQAGDKLVVHIIGVGAQGGPQVREAIDAMKASGKGLEVHLMDIRPELLNAAVEQARARFPGVTIIPHEIDITMPNEAPARRADVMICTNVTLHISPWAHSVLGLHNLSSFMKTGGYALVDHSDIGGPVVDLKELGLRVADRVNERGSDAHGTYVGVGLILTKTAEPIAFHRVWGKVKGWKEETRKRALGGKHESRKG